MCKIEKHGLNPPFDAPIKNGQQPDRLGNLS